MQLILLNSINIKMLIQFSLQKGHSETIENLSDEMREDYLLSVKKAIGKHLIFTLSVLQSITLHLWQLYATVSWHPEVTYHGTINLFIKSWYFSFSVDFVLKDQREKEKDVEEKRPPHREEMDVVPKPWHKDYVAGLEAMSQKLHITTPCMLQVLDFWHTKFG